MHGTNHTVFEKDPGRRALVALSRIIDLALLAPDEQALWEQACALLHAVGYSFAGVYRRSEHREGEHCDNAQLLACAPNENNADFSDGGPSEETLDQDTLSRREEAAPVDTFFAGCGPNADCVDRPVVARGEKGRPFLCTPFSWTPSQRFCLVVEVPEKDGPDPAELGVLKRVGKALSHGLGSQRIEAEHLGAEASAFDQGKVLQAIYDASPDMISIHLPGGRAVDINSKAVDRLGYGQAQLNRLSLGALCGLGYSEERARERFDKAFEGEAQEFEWGAVDAGGGEFPVEVRLRRLDLPRQQRVLAVIRDLSERHAAETEALKLNKLRTLSTLAGGIAHDLNNLLMGVLGNIGLASLHASGEPLELLEEAQKATLSAAALARQLSQFAQGAKGETQPVKLGFLAKTAAQFALRTHAVKLRLSLPASLPPVRADPEALTQVLHNICLNAVQSMQGEGALSLKASEVVIGDGHPGRLSPGNYVCLCLEDTGPGVPQDMAANIFDPYFTTKELGSGLGLATSFSIVRAFGGHLALIPSLQGALFELLLQVSEERERPAAEERKSRVYRPRRILILEDDILVAKVLKHSLQSAGHRAELAIEGAQALELYRVAMSEDPFDLVVLDLAVPGGRGGMWTLEALRRLNPQIIAIASSGYTGGLDDERLKKAGFAVCLPKPYSPQKLLLAIDGLSDPKLN